MPAIPKGNVDNATIRDAKALWQNRLSSLDPIFDLESERLRRLISSTISARDPVQPSPFVRENTLPALLNGLSAFAKEQFNFFYEGFFEANAHTFSSADAVTNRRYKKFEKLPIPDTHDAVLSTILSQISYDLEVLARINDQRFAKGPVADRLLETDQLAIGALLAMGDAFDLTTQKPTTVVTYFSNRMNIRVVPYIPVAMIAIPMTALNEERDLLAIPHEVGHLLYWKSRITRENNGQSERLRVAKRLRTLANDDWIYEWEEEIFADVVGCLIGGPAMVAGLHDLMKTQVGDEFIGDDGDHPIPAIRPYILSYVLKNFLTEGNLAETRWDKVLDDRSVNLDNTNAVVNGQSNTLAHWRTIVEAMVKTMVESVLLPNDAKLSSFSADLRWSTGMNNFDRGLLLSKISGMLTQNQTKVWDPPFVGIPSKTSLQTERENFWKERLSATVLDRLTPTPPWWNVTQNKINSNSLIPADDWISILEFGGWMTEGPGPGNAH